MQPALPSAPEPHRRRRSAAAKRNAEPDARVRLIKAGAQLFCRYGINATGVDAIVTEAGTTKATLYRIFGSKESLVEAVLEAESKAWRDWFTREVDALSCPGAEKLVRVFDILKAWFEDQSFYGCPFINAVGEHDKSDDHIRRAALRHKRVILGKLAELAEDAGARDPQSLTHQIALLIDGATVAALITLDSSMADTARRAAEHVVAAELGGSAKPPKTRARDGEAAIG